MSSSLPPPPEAPRRSTPFWKRWWFWAIVVVVILIGIGAGIAETTQTEAEAGSPSPVTSATQPPVPSPVETALVPDGRTSGCRSRGQCPDETDEPGAEGDSRVHGAVPRFERRRRRHRHANGRKAAPEGPQGGWQDDREREAGAQECRLRGWQGDAADVQPEEGDRDLAVARRRDIGASRPGGLARRREASSATTVWRLSGVLTMHPARAGRRLWVEEVTARGLCPDRFGSLARTPTASTAMAMESAANSHTEEAEGKLQPSVCAG